MAPVRLLAVLALGLFLPATGVAQRVDMTGTIGTVCKDLGRCSKAGGSVIFRLTGDFGAPRFESDGFKLRLKPVGRAEDGCFSTFTARAPDLSVMLLSISSEGFFLTQHGLFEPQAADGAVPTASPSVQTRYGTCTETAEGTE